MSEQIIVKVSNIDWNVQGREILHRLNFEVGNSQAVGVFGPSGCGKTSLIRLLAGFETSSSGLVEFRGGRSDHPSRAYVSQDFPLWPNVRLGEMKLISGGRKDLFFWEALEIDSLLDRFPRQISAGQRQRVSLALALDQESELLLLDEITSAQDVESCERIFGLIESVKNGGTSVVFTTHLMGFLSKVSDSVIFLDEGMIVEQGQVGLLSSPSTSRLKRFMEIGGGIPKN